MPSSCHYRGNVVDNLVAMAEAGHLFGPDICGPAPAGQVLGRGAFYELDAAEYDPGTDRTTARFRPHVAPTHDRVRYHGGDAAPPDDDAGPTLHRRDEIEGR